MHPKVSVGVPAPGSIFPASRTKSQINFHVINDTASGILLQQQKSDQQLPACHGACPQPYPAGWLLCVGGKDLEDAGVPERGCAIPEAMSQLGDEQVGDITQEVLQPSSRGEVESHWPSPGCPRHRPTAMRQPAPLFCSLPDHVPSSCTRVGEETVNLLMQSIL